MLVSLGAWQRWALESTCVRPYNTLTHQAMVTTPSSLLLQVQPNAVSRSSRRQWSATDFYLVQLHMLLHLTHLFVRKVGMHACMTHTQEYGLHSRFTTAREAPNKPFPTLASLFSCASPVGHSHPLSVAGRLASQKSGIILVQLLSGCNLLSQSCLVLSQSCLVHAKPPSRPPSNSTTASQRSGPKASRASASAAGSCVRRKSDSAARAAWGFGREKSRRKYTVEHSHLGDWCHGARASARCPTGAARAAWGARKHHSLAWLL